MSDHPWLPDLLRPSDFDGWDAYIAHAYGVFVQDFFKTQPMFRGCRVLVDGRLGDDGRIAYFRHLVTRDPRERELTRDDNFDGARCERIAWIRAMIENAGEPSRVCCWYEADGSRGKWTIALPDFSYLVALGERTPKYYVLTAFPPDKWTRYPEKMRKKYEAYRASQKS